jgi:hypothetical protein
VFCCFLGCVSDFSFSNFLISSGSASGRDAVAVPPIVLVESSVCFLFASPAFSCVVSVMGHAKPVLGV